MCWVNGEKAPECRVAVSRVLHFGWNSVTRAGHQCPNTSCQTRPLHCLPALLRESEGNSQNSEKNSQAEARTQEGRGWTPRNAFRAWPCTGRANLEQLRNFGKSYLNSGEGH
jgi:hypothetical protein